MHTSNDTLPRTDRAILAMTPRHIAVFYSRVDITPGHGSNGDCHVWTGNRDCDGYGWFCLPDTGVRAHRAAFFIVNGHLPPSEAPHALHSCDHPPCVRGDHLWAGTNEENRADCKAKGRTSQGKAHGASTNPALKPRGAMVHNAKLTDAKIQEIRARYAAGGIRIVDLSFEYGVSISSIGRILLRQTWAHVA